MQEGVLTEQAIDEELHSIVNESVKVYQKIGYEVTLLVNGPTMVDLSIKGIGRLIFGRTVDGGIVIIEESGLSREDFEYALSTLVK